MKLNEIRTFVTVAEAQSVQEAGNRLGLTQSAVSRLIQRLEAELGVVLFDRQSKPLVLTRDGELALAHARRILAATADLTGAFAGSAEPRGLLRLGVAHVLLQTTAHAPLDDLRARFPGLTLRLHSDWSTPLLDQVRNGSLDGAVVLTHDDDTPPSELDSVCLSREEVRVIAAAGARDLPPTLAAMNATGWVVQPEGCRYRSAMAHALGRSGLTPNVTVEAFDQTLLVSLVARGVGYGLAPLRLIARTADAARIRPVAVPDFSLTIAVWLVRGRNVGRAGIALDALEDSLRHELSLPAEPPARSLECLALHSAAE
ncbi:LysR family transcriptional regulator [Azospirillum thermophilum]|uniref:LysR family transcriptional regulator n=1 Tax=Azospirillum thermophilum TaxID=2202148 RepID=A0A2S2CQC8_9PROT|nr:LysR family transcriptional regulator [Azospirillum thermophilum]AWK86686.1 LysR family transcriptional regulator [Azospirillum thermophilum]